MPRVKKIEVNLGEDGPRIVWISVNPKNGAYSCDLGAHVWHVTRVETDGFFSLEQIQKAIYESVRIYRDSKSVEERIIAVSVSSAGDYSYNSGEQYHMNKARVQFFYVVLDKTTFGSTITYNLVRPDAFDGGKLKRMGNRMDIGKMTEIPFTQEAYDTLENIRKTMELLGDKLNELVSDADILQTRLLGGMNLLAFDKKE